jgi:DNA repair protein RecO (recombination protein O)
MEWTDHGVVLSARKHGENAAIVTLLTEEHGRHAGLIRGAMGKRARGVFQPGNRVTATWRARIADHLGTFSCELLRASSAGLLDDPLRLAGLSAACAMAATALPEREPHRPLYNGLVEFLGALPGEDWPSLYVRWELDLLKELGFGLDLSSCAATGRNDQLAYVSPKSGQAVSLAAGEPYRRALLPLPPFLLTGHAAESQAEIAKGLTLAEYFLERHVFAEGRQKIPAARRRLAERFSADLPSPR